MSLEKKEKPNFLQQYFKPLIFLLVILILSAFYLFLCQPQIDKISFYNTSYLNDKKEQLKNSQKALAELKAINEIYKNISDELRQKVKKILPAGPELSNLYYSLDAIAQKFSFKVTSVAINPIKNQSTENAEANKTMTKALEVSVVVESGGYQTIKDYVVALTHNLRIFDIKTFNYDPKKTDLSLVLRTYYTEE